MGGGTAAAVIAPGAAPEIGGGMRGGPNGSMKDVRAAVAGCSK